MFKQGDEVICINEGHIGYKPGDTGVVLEDQTDDCIVVLFSPDVTAMQGIGYRGNGTGKCYACNFEILTPAKKQAVQVLQQAPEPCPEEEDIMHITRRMF